MRKIIASEWISLDGVFLVDELRLLVHPVIMEKGTRFFTDGMHAKLQLIRTLTLDLGVIMLEYRPA
jgi:dihydrofolate reductase